MVGWCSMGTFNDPWDMEAEFHDFQFLSIAIPMTDPWCCYIWCAMDPIKINPLYVSIYIYTSTMDPSWDIRWCPQVFNRPVFFTISDLLRFDGFFRGDIRWRNPALDMPFSVVNFDHYACHEGLLVQHEPAHGIIGSSMVKLEWYGFVWK